MKKFLVISNCQTYGLANSLNLCGHDVKTDACDIWQFKREADHWKSKIHEYDHIVIHPEIQDLEIINFKQMSNVTWVPGFYFDAFHKDLTYATSNGIQVKSALDDYNSRIILTSYKSGLTPSQTESLFNLDVYKKIGYLTSYEKSKRDIINLYADYNIDISSALLSWMRQGVFCHSVNHPKINVIYDIALIILKNLGIPTKLHGHRPHDNLANGPGFPIYKEIAEYYGFDEGSDFYKPSGEYNVMSLEEYINNSYEHYNKFEIESIIYPPLDVKYETALITEINEVKNEKPI